MGDLFNLDNPVWRFISKVFDAFILSILFLITSIPIITIGASASALYHALIKLVNDEEGYITKDYFKGFKQNFKQATLSFLIVFVIFILLIIDLLFALGHSNHIWANIMYSFFSFLICSFFIFSTYLFALIARFENTTKNLFKFSFILFIKHFGWSVIIFLLFLFCVMSSFKYPPLILAIPGFHALITSYIFNHIFDRYSPKEDEDKDKNN